MNASLESDLKNSIQGEVHFDSIHRRIYSVDASIYEVLPLGIVIPKSKEDLIASMAIAAEYKVSIIPRGAATGITGGCLGKGLVIDTSKYLNRITEINYEKEYAICEPGVIQDQLNNALASKGYRLGPDTSTGNRATIGGMLANNAAGARSLSYGKMVDHILEVELLLATGENYRFGQITDQDWAKKRAYSGREGKIYREIYWIKQHYHDEIKARFPNIPRRVSGYNLDELLKPDLLNVCKLISGSEGTLGIAAEIKVRLSKKPKATGLCVVHFQDMIQAMTSIPNMLAFNPLSLEMIDRHIMTLGAQSPMMKGKMDWLSGDPNTVFIAEFEAEDTQSVIQKLTTFEHAMKDQKIGYAHTRLLGLDEMSHVWDVRKAGLGLLMSKRTYNRAIAFIEDITVAPEQLPSFMEEFLCYLASIGKEAGVYGHVGSGCMHLRPFIDLRKKDELHLMETMMEKISDLLLRHRGALSGEHGDGRVRSWLNKKMFGEKIYAAFIGLKSVFDPDNRMNPGKIVNGTPLLEELRLSPETQVAEITTFLDFSREGGLAFAADMCNGNGLCRKSEALMCPSFQATRDEYDTTRARAQALRGMIHGHMPMEEYAGKGIQDVLDLCLECKGCKTECPSQVDMAKMKAELLFQYQERHGYPLRNLLFGNIALINRFSAPFARLINGLGKFGFSKFLLSKIGISPERELPQLAHQRFSKWFKKHSQIESKNSVILFNDTYTEFNHPEIGKAAVELLNTLGYQVIVPQWQCCGRPLISKGILKKARSYAADLINGLYPYVLKGLPIIGLEPSCILTIRDDFRDFHLDHLKVEAVVRNCITLDEFLDKHIEKGKLPISLKNLPREVRLHGHCHQKSLVGMRPTLNVLKAIPGCNVIEIPSGCCGMAGSFGYEIEHYDLSMKIGELRLFPMIRSASEDALIVANGFSCRTQIYQATGKKALHLAEIIRLLSKLHSSI